MFHKTGSRQVHSVSFGEGPGTFVGIAGSFANWEIWSPVFEILSRQWRVVGFDHDGVGQTRVPLEEITHEQHLETLFSVLDAQDIERCVIAGDSSNATLAIEAVLEQPERFDGLVIVNGEAWGFDDPRRQRFVAGLRADFEATLAFFVKLVFPEPDSAHLQSWLYDVVKHTGAEAAARILEGYYGIDLRPRLTDIQIPVMIVHGVLDVTSPSSIENVHELTERLSADLHLIQGAGHLPLLSRPQEVANFINTFLVECYTR